MLKPQRRYDDVLQLIGNTPIVRINRAVDRRAATLWAKLEYRNPGGSLKDRIAINMLLEAENSGRIRAGRTTIIEATSGNTGIGLAMVCAVRGYRLILTMPDDLSEERRQLLMAYGAECVVTPAARVMQGAIDEAERIGRTLEDPFFPQQAPTQPTPRPIASRRGRRSSSPSTT